MRPIPSPLKDRRILIIESEVVLAPNLQDALEHEGTETVLVRDPHSLKGAEHIAQYQFCAAAINAVHSGVAEDVTVPVLFYGENERVPADVDAIVKELRTLLAE